MDKISKLAIQEARDRLIRFCIVYDRNYLVNWHHREIANALEKVESGEIKRLIIEMPPRHGKSQLASIYFPAWYLGRNPDKEIITASYSGDLAKDFGSKTRDVVNSNRYKDIFDVSLKQDSKAKDKWTTNSGGSYTSVGRGGATTGRGANIFLIDDPVKDREEAESITIREKTWGWYTSVVNTRLEKNGAIVIIMTRWHTDDLVSRVLDKSEETGEDWTIVSFPAIAEEDEKYRKKGEPLWSAKKDLDELDVIKALNIYDWFALYQQVPIAAEIQEFKQDWFKYWNDDLLKGKDLYYYDLVDLAGEKVTSDNNVVLTIAKERTSPEIYIIDCYAGHYDPGEVIDRLFFNKNKYGNRYVRAGIETVAYQKSFEYWVKEEQKKRQVYFDVVSLKAKTQKEIRIRGLVPMYKAGVIYHNNRMTDLETELITFPRGKTDDRIDALAYMQQVLKPTVLSNQARVTFTPKYR